MLIHCFFLPVFFGIHAYLNCYYSDMGHFVITIEAAFPSLWYRLCLLCSLIAHMYHRSCSLYDISIEIFRNMKKMYNFVVTKTKRCQTKVDQKSYLVSFVVTKSRVSQTAEIKQWNNMRIANWWSYYPLPTVLPQPTLQRNEVFPPCIGPGNWTLIAAISIHRIIGFMAVPHHIVGIYSMINKI